jgi:hypothetical protein
MQVLNRLKLTCAWLIPAVLALASCTSKDEGRIASVISGSNLRFTEIHDQVGLDVAHTYHFQRTFYQPMTGGVACADYNGDGYLDLYVLAGDVGNYLYRNDGGTGFTEVAVEAGVRAAGGAWSGSTFADINGDGHLDLFLCGIAGTPVCILLNNGDGTFSDATPGSGLDAINTDTWCVTFGDYDGDDDLDLFLSQYLVEKAAGVNTQHLWRNDGNAKFTDVSIATGVTQALTGGLQVIDMTMTPNFVDVDSDGDLDILVTGDGQASHVLINDNGSFSESTSAGVVQDHATGAAIGDYDNDGDMDWFVSGISYPGLDGNGLFTNDGNGSFTNTTQVSGVGSGGWGWGSSFGDLDNDGFLDLVQVNGYGTSPVSSFNEFFEDPVRLFMNLKDGRFEQRAELYQLVDNQLGRGVALFDFDRDGDLDVFIQNILGTPSLWKNEGGNAAAYLSVGLRYKGANPFGIGSRIRVTVGGDSQIREIRAGCNYVSQNPAEAHFGIADSNIVDLLEVFWPDGSTTEIIDVATRQHLVVEH